MRDNPYDDDPGQIEVDMWEEYVDRVNRPRKGNIWPFNQLGDDTVILGKSAVGMIHAIVPPEAIEEDHIDYPIFLAWRALQQAIDTRSYRLQEEEMAWADSLDIEGEH